MRGIDDAATDVPAKSTLFCSACGHASRADGDWLVVEGAGASRYLCPVCDAVVTRRPRYGEDETDVEGPLSAWARCWRSWGRAVVTWQQASRDAIALD